jgi:hypothetical protein
MKPDSFIVCGMRTLGFLAVGIWSWYFCAMFRTSGWGYANFLKESLATLLVFSFFALPFAFIPLIGIPWRRKFVALGILAAICMLSVELFARGQEHLLVQRFGKQPTNEYTESRWWPFEHHSLGVVQGQWWGCD